MQSRIIKGRRIQKVDEKNEPHWKEDYIPIPKFHLQMTTRQFGNGAGRVMTMVIVMECTAEDAGYLK
eukprot:10325880-Ditylum_brightwellii.AAC.1